MVKKGSIINNCQMGIIMVLLGLMNAFFFNVLETSGPNQLCLNCAPSINYFLEAFQGYSTIRRESLILPVKYFFFEGFLLLI
jgi:hypothetical protein